MQAGQQINKKKTGNNTVYSIGNDTVQAGQQNTGNNTVYIYNTGNDTVQAGQQVNKNTGNNTVYKYNTGNDTVQAGQQVNKILVIILYTILVLILCKQVNRSIKKTGNNTTVYSIGNDTVQAGQQVNKILVIILYIILVIILCKQVNKPTHRRDKYKYLLNDRRGGVHCHAAGLFHRRHAGPVDGRHGQCVGGPVGQRQAQQIQALRGVG